MSDYQKAIIIWFDGNIGRSDCCLLLKRAFVKALIPKWDRATFLDDITIDTYVINDFSHSSYTYKNTAIELYAFSNEEDCAKCIEKNEGKRIFFVVSLALGKRIVPQIVKKCPEALQKSSDHRLRSVYVFRYNVSTVDGLWCMKYPEYMLSFSCEDDLARKLINDIAYYFIKFGQQQYNFGTSASIHQSLEYFDWAQTLLGRVFGRVDAWQCKDITRNLDTEIAQSKGALRNLSTGVDIDQFILSSESVHKSEVVMSELCEQILNATSRPVLTVPTHVENDNRLAGCASSISSSPDKEKSLLQTLDFVNNEPIKSEIKVYLQLPSFQTDNFKNFLSLLKNLLATNLIVTSEVQSYFNEFKANDSPIIVQTLSNDEDDKCVLGKICSMRTSISLYVLGAQPNAINTRQDFFTKYPQVCAISDDPKELAIKIILDVVLKSRIMGDRYARNKDKERATVMYDQCISLLNGLNESSLTNIGNKT